MTAGKFITFEGLDGCGKSTQTALAAKWLRARHRLSVLETREPGGTPLGESLRPLIVDSPSLDPLAELLLLLAARRQHIREKIKPALARGVWVLCDRFADSTLAYQGGGRGIDRALIDSFSARAAGDLHPDATFYFAATVRPPLLGEHTFERAGGEFFCRVRKVYDDLAATATARITTIDGAQRGIDEVHKIIQLDIARRFLS